MYGIDSTMFEASHKNNEVEFALHTLTAKLRGV